MAELLEIFLKKVSDRNYEDGFEEGSKAARLEIYASLVADGMDPEKAQQMVKLSAEEISDAQAMIQQKEGDF